MARPPLSDLSCLCREPVGKSQLSPKLVTVQPQSCQLNGLFIYPRAMHYGHKLLPLMLLCVPFLLNTY